MNLVNLTLSGDRTQEVLLPHMKHTGEMLEMISGGECTCFAMQDLCIPINMRRLGWGFPTGSRWILRNMKKKVVFPGMTVNVCSVDICEINGTITIQEFKKNFDSVIGKTIDGFTLNNFSRGNHFVALTKSRTTGKYYIVVHASSNEQRKFLYPEPDAVFLNDLKKFVHPDHPERYTYYLESDAAEQFSIVSNNLFEENVRRNDTLLRAILGDKYTGNTLYAPHYGMKSGDDWLDCNIGVQSFNPLEKRILPLLTEPGGDIYMIAPSKETTLFPHGFGSGKVDCDLTYNIDHTFTLSGRVFDVTDPRIPHERIHIGKDIFVRSQFPGNNVDKCVESILSKTPGIIVDRLEQIASVSAIGFKIHR